MHAIKKINNNVAVCIDGNGDELVAFGKGIGFKKMPYEIADMSLISMTFYRVDMRSMQLLKEIPENVMQISAEIVVRAQALLPDKSFSPNIIFSLADHLNFAIIRLKDYKGMKMPLDYDIKQMYPVEYQIGRYACQLFKERVQVVFPDSEAVAVAMHLINAENEVAYTLNDESFDDMARMISNYIEDFFQIKIDRDEFSYNRFLTHLRYYFKRIQDDTPNEGEINPTMLSAFKREEPKVYQCSVEVVNQIDHRFHTTTSDDEMFYLMVYINRIVKKSQIENGG